MNDEQPKSLETTIIAWADAFKDITETAKKSSETIQDLLDLEIKHIHYITLCQKLKLREYFIKINKSRFPLRMLYVHRYKKLLKQYKAMKRVLIVGKKNRNAMEAKIVCEF